MESISTEKPIYSYRSSPVIGKLGVAFAFISQVLVSGIFIYMSFRGFYHLYSKFGEFTLALYIIELIGFGLAFWLMFFGSMNRSSQGSDVYSNRVVCIHPMATTILTFNEPMTAVFRSQMPFGKVGTLTLYENGKVKGSFLTKMSPELKKIIKDNKINIKNYSFLSVAPFVVSGELKYYFSKRHAVGVGIYFSIVFAFAFLIEDTPLEKVNRIYAENGLNQMIDYLKEIVQENPSPVLVNSLARALVTHPKVEMRNYGEAIVFSHKAVNDVKSSIFRSQFETNYADTMACAYFGYGNIERANQISREYVLEERIKQFSQGIKCGDTPDLDAIRRPASVPTK